MQEAFEARAKLEQEPVLSAKEFDKLEWKALIGGAKREEVFRSYWWEPRYTAPDLDQPPLRGKA